MDGELGRRADRPPATERYFLSCGLAVFRECVGEVQLPGGCSAWSRPVWQRSAGPLRRFERSRALTRIPASAPRRVWTRIDVGDDLHSGAGSRGLAGWVGENSPEAARHTSAW